MWFEFEKENTYTKQVKIIKEKILKRNSSKRGDTGYVEKFDQHEYRSRAPEPRLIYRKQINHENLIY